MDRDDYLMVKYIYRDKTNVQINVTQLSHSFDLIVITVEHTEQLTL